MNITILIITFLAALIVIKLIMQLPDNDFKDKFVYTETDKSISIYDLPYWLRFLVWLDGLFNCKWQALCNKVEAELEKYSND